MTLHSTRTHHRTDLLVDAGNEVADALASFVKSTLYQWHELTWQWRKTAHRLGAIEHVLQQPTGDVARAARRFAEDVQKSYLRALAALR